MGSRGFDRRRSNDSKGGSAYNHLKKQNKEAMESELVEVQSDMKGHVIGKGGCNIKEIMAKSGAKISSRRDEDSFSISGDTEQRARARSLILEKVQEIQRKRKDARSLGEHVEIPQVYKGLVMGKGGDNLRDISTQTGAKVTRKDGEVYIASGTEQQRQQAKLYISTIIAGARLRGVENEFNKVCRFIDGCNLPGDCKLKLEQVSEGDRMVLPGLQSQWRLKPTEDYEHQEPNSSTDGYHSQIMDAALKALRQIKYETVQQPKADMWCHLGKAIIRGADEEEVTEGEWSIDEVTAKLQSSEAENYWKVAFKEGVNLDEKILEGNLCETTTEDFKVRYDLTYSTPCGHQVRCKVWVAKADINKKLEDISIPFSDVKNILETIHFEDEVTRSRCQGWLVLPSRRYLQADILFPSCEFDCRLTIRGRTDRAVNADYAPDEETRLILSKYLSGLTFDDEDDFGLRLPEETIPEGFHLIHKRSSKRTLYTANEGYAIILSKESSWRSDILNEDSRESTDLHLHCKEWDETLCTEDWEPDAIVAKLPEFLKFLKQVQSFVAQEMAKL